MHGSWPRLVPFGVLRAILFEKRDPLIYANLKAIEADAKNLADLNLYRAIKQSPVFGFEILFTFTAPQPLGELRPLCVGVAAQTVGDAVVGRLHDVAKLARNPFFVFCFGFHSGIETSNIIGCTGRDRSKSTMKSQHDWGRSTIPPPLTL